MPIESINPATNKTIQSYSRDTQITIEQTLARAETTQKSWANTPLETRCNTVVRFAEQLQTRKDECARLMTQEMGKTLSNAHAEIEKCIAFCHYVAEQAPVYLADNPLKSEYKRSFTRPYPLGTILLVMPWNFPFWQVIRVAVPALLAGNTCILKHASNVPGCALLLQDVFMKAGFFDGCFQTLLIKASAVGDIIADPRVHGASVTGSEEAGKAVAGHCAAHIKPCVLELGGSDPFIVMPSANIQAALDAAMTSRMRNNGQSCLAAKRILVHQDIHREFRDGFIARMNTLRVGDPMEPTTDIGPLARESALKNTWEQIQLAKEFGAEFIQSQAQRPKHGAYIVPGVLEEISPTNPVLKEEIFAPIAMLIPVVSMDEAIKIANNVPFGLSSVLFSQDEDEIETAINTLQAGSTFVNRYASSDIRMPFGGIKKSGIGREMGKEGMLAFTNLKTIMVAQ